MKLELEEHFVAASGRACQSNGIYNRTNRHTGQVVAVKLCNPYRGPGTEAQIAARNAMAQRMRIAKAWRAANAPTKQNPKGTDEYQALYSMWKSDRRYPSWYSLLLTKIKDGAVPSFIEEVAVITPPSGGGSGSTSGGDDFTPPEMS